MWRTIDNFLNSYGGIVVLVIGILILIALLAPYFTMSYVFYGNSNPRNP